MEVIIDDDVCCIWSIAVTFMIYLKSMWKIIYLVATQGSMEPSGSSVWIHDGNNTAFGLGIRVGRSLAKKMIVCS